MSFDRDRLAARLRSLADQGVYLGTSSWKYPGWFGTVYDRDTYVWRGRFSETRFERNCLAEFSRLFPTVSVDAGYYQFFTGKALQEMADQVPDHFRFAFKVCCEVTLKGFPSLPRFGTRAGQNNPNFLNPRLFCDATLEALEPIRNKVGLLMFEFSKFWPGDFARGAEFVSALDAFFSQLPRDWPYAVELRNRHWLRPEYFSVLARHGVTHIYNAWADSPPVPNQLSLAGSETNPAQLAARFLLREGRTFEEAVKRFSPYNEIQDPNPEGREAAALLARRGLLSSRQNKKARTFILVGNRFEGHSPGTIDAIAAKLESAHS